MSRVEVRAAFFPGAGFHVAEPGLDDLAVESDPRAERLLDLMRERGWTGWTRLERLAGQPD